MQLLKGKSVSNKKIKPKGYYFHTAVYNTIMLPVVEEWILVHVEYYVMTRFTLFHQKKTITCHQLYRMIRFMMILSFNFQGGMSQQVSASVFNFFMPDSFKCNCYFVNSHHKS
jgi:hypothetical protein